MKKIPTIFIRSDNHNVLNEMNPDCGWVFGGEGIATRKFDGTCCMVDDKGDLFKRREIRDGKPTPPNFIEADYDEITGKHIGWVPVSNADPADKYHLEAYPRNLEVGTYELCGPKIQGNPEQLAAHQLIPHGIEVLDNVPRDYNGLREYLEPLDIEGIVFYHPDGRMAKIKKRDFGLKRNLL